MFPNTVSCQQKPEEIFQIDSLKSVIKKAKHDSTIVMALIAWSDLIYVSDPTMDFNLMQKVDSLCDVNIERNVLKEKNFFLKYKAMSLNNLGNFHQEKGEYSEAINYHNRSLEIQKKLGHPNGIALSLNNIAVVYSKFGAFDKAIDYFTKSLNIQEKAGNPKGISMSLNNIGLVYKNQGDLDEALHYYTKSLKMEQELDNKFKISLCLHNIGQVYFLQDDFETSMKYEKRGLRISKEIGDMVGVATAFHSIGAIFEEQGDPHKALEYYLKSLEIRNTIDDKAGIAASLIIIGENYSSRGLYLKALKNHKEALDLSLNIGEANASNAAYKALWKTYKKMGLFKESLEMHEKYLSSKETIESKKNQKEIYRQKYKYEYEKRAYSDSIVALQKDQLTDYKIRYQQLALNQKETINNLLIGGVIVLVIWLLALAYQKKQVSKQRKVIAKQNDEREKIIQEIHHRVKNNLQIVTSLLRLQQYRVNDVETINLLENCQGRIVTMAGIHERIYKLGEYKEIKVEKYLVDLINSILESNHLNNHVKLVHNVSDLTMITDVVVPLALIINEVVTNSCKHAFENHENPKIFFELDQKESGDFLMKLSDNGQGVNTPQTSNDSLGTELIEVFSEQLEGTMNVSFKNGTEYSLTFPIQT